MRIHLVRGAIICGIGFVICYALSLAATMEYAPLRAVTPPQGFTAGNAMFLVAIVLGIAGVVLMGYVWTRDDEYRGKNRTW